ncbi:hypothetical protein JCM8202_002717, partial [Rhodotorula sphaerocarpa]
MEKKVLRSRPSVQVVIQVCASGLNSTDQILRGDCLVGIDLAVTPGQAVVGEVVQTARKGENKMKKGDRVA